MLFKIAKHKHTSQDKKHLFHLGNTSLFGGVAMFLVGGVSVTSQQGLFGRVDAHDQPWGVDLRVLAGGLLATVRGCRHGHGALPLLLGASRGLPAAQQPTQGEPKSLADNLSERYEENGIGYALSRGTNALGG